MSNWTQLSLAKLKTLVRYWKRERQWEGTCSVMEEWPKSDDMFRFRLGRLQRNSRIIKRRRDTARQSHSESIHAQAKDHCKKQCSDRAVCGGIGSV